MKQYSCPLNVSIVVLKNDKSEVGIGIEPYETSNASESFCRNFTKSVPYGRCHVEKDNDDLVLVIAGARYKIPLPNKRTSVVLDKIVGTNWILGMSRKASAPGFSLIQRVAFPAANRHGICFEHLQQTEISLIGQLSSAYV